MLVAVGRYGDAGLEVFRAETAEEIKRRRIDPKYDDEENGYSFFLFVSSLRVPHFRIIN